MFLRFAVFLFLLAGFANAEEREFKGFKKGELVVMQIYHPIESWKPLAEYRFVCCRILEVTPKYLKIKRYYISEVLTDRSQPDDVKFEKEVLVYSVDQAWVGEILGWPDGKKKLPKPGPFDLW
jgi:hypothetical protein